MDPRANKDKTSEEKSPPLCCMGMNPAHSQAALYNKKKYIKGSFNSQIYKELFVVL